jgi:hypothetical protein
MSDSRVDTFRMSFWTTLDWTIVYGLGLALVGSLIASAFFRAATGLQADPFFAVLGLVTVAMALLCVIVVAIPLAAIVTWLFPVHADDVGVGGFGGWGLRRAAKWNLMTSARPVNVGGLPYLRVMCDDGRSPLWIPLFLTDRPGFASLVLQEAPTDNAVRAYFEQSAD